MMLWLLFCLLGLVFGNLNNGTSNAGVGCSNGDNTLGNARWNILARISELIVSNLNLHHHAFLAAAKIDTGPPGK